MSKIKTYKKKRKIFGGSEKDNRLESFDDQHGLADLELNGEIETSLDLNVEEMKELASYIKANQETEKDSIKFLYNGVKKLMNDVVSGIETRGKEIVNSIHDVYDEWKRRDHQSDLLHIKNVQEKDDLMNELGKKN